MSAPLIALIVLAASLAGGFLALFVATIPAMRRLPGGNRAALDGVQTIDDAVAACEASGLAGWELVAYAQQLAARRFTYSRRNPWDSPARAFRRGMGYCQQQAHALRLITNRLGIEAQPVYATRARFPAREIHGMPEPGGVSGHTWLRVRVGGEVRDVCPGDARNRPGVVHFEPQTPVRPMTALLRPFAHLGSVVANLRRDRAALRRVAQSGQ